MSSTSRRREIATCWNCEGPLDQPTDVELQTPAGETTTLTLCGFCVLTAYLPLATTTPELSIRSRRSERVLVVEDDAYMRRLLESVLVTEGYRVKSAANGAEALTKAREEAPDAIVLDLRMPVMDGPSFLRAWRESTPEASTPVIAISGHRLNVTAEELGVSAILPKPFEYTMLVGAVAALFDEGRSVPGSAS